MDRPSEEFLDSLRNRGRHARIDCPHGLTWFDGSNDGGWDWEPGEHESLNRLASAKYKSADGGASSIHYAGRTFVEECDLCMRQLAWYEAFLWANRDQIADFMEARAKTLRGKAAEADRAATACRS